LSTGKPAIWIRPSSIDYSGTLCVWVILSLIKALKFKYGANFKTYKAREEAVGLLLSLAPWIGPADYYFFQVGTSCGSIGYEHRISFIMALQMKNHISQSKKNTTD